MESRILFCPVVTDPREAASALNWAVREMMERYNLFKELGVRNISGYNQKIKTVEDPEKAGYSKMPSLVIIVDEFADLMMVASKEVEDAGVQTGSVGTCSGNPLSIGNTATIGKCHHRCYQSEYSIENCILGIHHAIDSRTILGQRWSRETAW